MKNLILTTIFLTSLHIKLFGGGYAMEPTQIMNNIELIQSVGLQNDQLNQLMQSYRELEHQTRELQSIKRQLSSVPTNWNVAKSVSYYRNLTGAMRRIQGVTWSAANTSDRLNKAYPLWESSEGKTFKEQYVAMAQNTREATESIMDNLYENHEKNMEYSENMEAINERVNTAEGQTAVMQANAQMLNQIHLQVMQLNNAINNQTSLLANFLNYEQAENSRQLADREAAVPVWAGDPDPLSGPGTDMKWK